MPTGRTQVPLLPHLFGVRGRGGKAARCRQGLPAGGVEAIALLAVEPWRGRPRSTSRTVALN